MIGTLFFWGIRWIFKVLYLTLLYLPPLRFHCVGGCWDRTQDCCDFGIGSSDARITRPDLISVDLDLIQLC